MLSTEKLSIGYEKNNALFEALDLRLSPNRLTVLLGANGAGKSSLLRTLAGLQRGLAGKVYWAGKELGHYKPQEIAQKISLVLTYRPQDSFLTVEEIIALGRFPYMRWYQGLQKEDKQLIENALELTNAIDLRQKRVATLSDGQLQKVMIARALAQDTPLILLDEPTAHLDLPHRFMIFELLQKLAHQTQKTVLVATHDLEPALQTADKVWLLHNQKCYVDIPEVLALEGILTEAFATDRLEYDIEKGKFHLKNTSLASVQLTCEPHISHLAYAQTQKALERVGFCLLPTASIQIHILPTDTGYAWEWVGKRRVEDLEELLDFLQGHLSDF